MTIFVRPTNGVTLGQEPKRRFYSRFSQKFPNALNEFIIQMHQNYLPMFVTNFVFQLRARSENRLHCLGHIAPPKVQVASLNAVRSRRECGDFQRPIERKRHSELPLRVLIVVFCISRSLKWIARGKFDHNFRRNRSQNGAFRKVTSPFPATKHKRIFVILHFYSSKYTLNPPEKPAINFLPLEGIEILKIHAKVDRMILTCDRRTWDARYWP